MDKYQMSFPTWDEIKRKLGISDKTNTSPENKFGDSPFQKSSESLWELYEEKYDDNKIGIDVPVLIVPNEKKNDRVIIILGESPLRKDSQFTDSNNVILGTPYAIHLNDESFPKQCQVYRKIFDELLNEGYSLYLTDIEKIWGKDKKLNFYFDVFGEELKKLNKVVKFKIVTIVTFGKTAAKAIKQMRKNVLFSIKELSNIEVPHPSIQNWSNWKLKILEGFVLKNDIKAAQDFCNNYNNEDGKIYEVIAKEALRIIHEGLKDYE